MLDPYILRAARGWRGRLKPPFGSRIRWDHPFAKPILMACLFDRGGNEAYRPAFSGGPIAEGPALIVSNGVKPRQATRTNSAASDAGKYTTNGEYGLGLSLGNEFAHLNFGESSWIPPKNVTVLVIERTLVANNPGYGFYTNTGGTNASEFACNLPLSTSGNVNFGFGPSTTFVTFTWPGATKPWCYAFTAGDAGQSGFVDGVKVFSHATAVSRTAASNDLLLCGTSNEGPKGSEWFYFAILNEQWTDDTVRWWSMDPYNHLEYGPSELMYFVSVLPETGTKFKINGTARDLLEDWDISETLTGPNTMSFSVFSRDGSWRPVRGQSVLFQDFDDGHIHFAGTIHSVTEGGWRSYAGSRGLEFQCEAQCPKALAARRLGELTVSTGHTLKQFLTTLVTNYLDDYGITLSLSQATGPTFSSIISEDLDFPFPTPITDMLDESQRLTKTYFWDIDYSYVLSSAPIGTVSYTPAPGTYVVSDVQVAISSEGYGNYITVQWTEPAVLAYNYFQLEESSNLADGDTVRLGGRTYTAEASFSDTPNKFLIGTDAEETMATFVAMVVGGGGEGSSWGTDTEVHSEVEAYNHVNAVGFEWCTIRALTAGAAGNSIQTECGATVDPAVGRFITEGGGLVSSLGFGLDAALTGKAIADGGAAAADRVDRNYAHPEITEESHALAKADYYLDRDSAAGQETTITVKDTLARGWRPGHKLVFVVATRDLSGDHLITAMRKYIQAGDIYYDVTLKEGISVIPQSEREQLRAMLAS